MRYKIAYSMNNFSKRRIPQYDVIRVVAIFFVFCIHSLGVANEEYAKGVFSFEGEILYNGFNIHLLS